ncbi:AAA family ATPase [candidate division NPL-UPA2 bacterium]|nr:AAA family ATPase [candidate division NPL-UPA2 bacterium]
MYTKHFKLREQPFFKVLEPKFLFNSSGHKELLARLHFSLMEKEMALVSGEIGSGKSTSVIEFMRQLRGKTKVAYIVNPKLCNRDLLSEIIQQLGNEEPRWFKRNLLDQLNKVILRCYDEQMKEPVLIIDEAQLLDRDTLEDIRLLTNYTNPDKKLLTIILIGQPELRRRLSLDTYEAFNQRIGVKYHFYGLERKETVDYVLHRIKAAGGDGDIFSQGALENIYDLSKGILRKINKLASTSLLHGFLLKKTRIDEAMVADASREIE